MATFSECSFIWVSTCQEFNVEHCGVIEFFLSSTGYKVISVDTSPCACIQYARRWPSKSQYTISYITVTF